MKFRLALVLALTASVNGPDTAGGVWSAQIAQDTDAVRSLLRRLEAIVRAGDTPAYLQLLSQGADRAAATGFAATELVSGATHVVLREREREPLLGTLPGNGFRLSIDVFVEFGARARSATWRLDVRRVGEDDDRAWVIADQQRLSTVENLFRLSLNPAKQFLARDLTVSVEDLDLVLPEGSAFVADTDQGTTGLILLGRGEMSFHPTPEVEKGQLKIFCGSNALRTRFDAIFIRVSPADVSALIGMDRLTPQAVNPREFKRAEEIFRAELPKSYSIDMADLSRDVWSVLPAGGDFVVEVRTPRYETLTYAHAGAEPEDVSFFDRKRHKNICVYTSRKTLVRRGRSYNEDDFANIDVLDYDLDVEVSPDRQWLDGHARLQLRVQGTVINSISLRLAESLVVQSVVSDRFGRLPGFRVRNQNTVLVNLPSFLLHNDELRLAITYAGRLDPQREEAEAFMSTAQSAGQAPADELPALQAERSFLYSNRSYWYPQAQVTDYATARIRVTVPAGFGCVGSGELAEGYPLPVAAKDSSAARKVYEFATSQPLRYLAFLISRFVRAQPTAVLMGSETNLNLSVLANPRQVRRGRELGERARDVAEFYESILNDYPYPSFTLALIESDLPGGHSPGYFAALNQPLPTTPYVWRNDPAAFDAYPEFFLAHEIAHQWWGQAAGWRNYHEQWLSEGFAQYFAALYAQHRRGEDAFAGMLRQFRRWGMQQSAEGPISLGYRLGHVRSDSRIFRALVYNKSAAVLHMLRRLVGDEAFFRGVRRFYASSRFRKVGTDDFRAAMEAESGRSLERFFEEWIYGSTLPRLKFRYRVEPGPNGQNIALHVEQIGEIFDVPVTVVLQYADRKDAQIVLPVTDRVADLSVPLAGAFRRADVSRNDGTLAEIIKD